MNKAALVSVVITCYNAEKYIRKCIESVLNQTYQNLQIVVINDGSTDKSLDILNEYAAKDYRIEIHTQKNAGVAGSKNAGVDNCKGDYLCILDSDDYYKSDFVETLLNVFFKNDVDIVCCDQNVDELTEFYNDNLKVLSKDEATYYYLKDDKYFSENLNMKMFKTSLWEGVRSIPNRIHEDTFTVYRLLEKTKSIAYLHYNGYVRTTCADSITNRAYTNKNYDNCYANSLIYEFYKNTKYKVYAFNKYLGSLLYFIIKTNGKKEVTLNKQAYVDLKVLISNASVAFKDVKNQLKPFLILFKLKMLKLIKI